LRDQEMSWRRGWLLVDSLIARQVGLLQGLGAFVGCCRSAIHCAIGKRLGADGDCL